MQSWTGEFQLVWLNWQPSQCQNRKTLLDQSVWCWLRLMTQKHMTRLGGSWVRSLMESVATGTVKLCTQETVTKFSRPKNGPTRCPQSRLTESYGVAEIVSNQLWALSRNMNQKSKSGEKSNSWSLTLHWSKVISNSALPNWMRVSIKTGSTLRWLTRQSARIASTLKSSWMKFAEERVRELWLRTRSHNTKTAVVTRCSK